MDYCIGQNHAQADGAAVLEQIAQLTFHYAVRNDICSIDKMAKAEQVRCEKQIDNKLQQQIAQAVAEYFPAVKSATDTGKSCADIVQELRNLAKKSNDRVARAFIYAMQ